MKTFTLLLALSALLFDFAQAQSLPKVVTTGPSPSKAKAIRTQTADRRAATYTGPKVVEDSKKLGREMLKDSKPAPQQQVAPTKQ